MAAAVDLALVLTLVLGAALFLLRRFTGPRQAPSCAPTDAAAKPQVIMGSTLARAMAARRSESS